MNGTNENRASQVDVSNYAESDGSAKGQGRLLSGQKTPLR